MQIQPVPALAIYDCDSEFAGGLFAARDVSQNCLTVFRIGKSAEKVVAGPMGCACIARSMLCSAEGFRGSRIHL